MMRCWVMLGGGGELELPTAISWKFCYGTDTPCDSFFVRCLWERGQEKVLSAACRFYAGWEGDRVFTGVVDEYAVICGKDGLYLEISGRGMAALLLDNEAMPAEYQRATRADIVADHVAPYGVAAVGGGGLPAVTGFTVTSGESEWSVVRRFACYYGGVVPRFDRAGRLVLDPPGDGEEVCVKDSDPVTGWEYREERHGVLSQVAVRRRTSWGTQWVSDGAFQAQGGCARRVITVPNTTQSHAVYCRLPAAGGAERTGADAVDGGRRFFGLAGPVGFGGHEGLWRQWAVSGGAGGGLMWERGADDHIGAGRKRRDDLRPHPPQCAYWGPSLRGGKDWGTEEGGSGMWLGGQQKRPVEESEGQVGVITMSGGETAALLDCERRGLQVYAPAGYRWTPKVGQRVMVIQGKGEIPCVVGARQDGDVPNEVTVEARRLSLQGDETRVFAQGDVIIQGENVRLDSQVYVKEETLEEMIARIVRLMLAGLM